MPVKYRKRFNRTFKTNRMFKGHTYTVKNTFKSPFATSFKNGLTKGMPCGMVVTGISKKTGKNVQIIFKSLCKAGLCKGQKINGQWVYWPTMKVRTNISNANTCKVKMWQCFVDWCMASGTCTTKQMTSKSITPKMFSVFCKKGFGKTVKSAGTTTGKKHTTRKNSGKRFVTSKWNTGRKTWATSWNTRRHPRSFRFPTYSSRVSTVNRRYRHAA